MRDAAYYRSLAVRFRKLAAGTDDRTAAALLDVAENYESEARRLAGKAPSSVVKDE